MERIRLANLQEQFGSLRSTSLPQLKQYFRRYLLSFFCVVVFIASAKLPSSNRAHNNDHFTLSSLGESPSVWMNANCKPSAWAKLANTQVATTTKMTQPIQMVRAGSWCHQMTLFLSMSPTRIRIRLGFGLFRLRRWRGRGGGSGRRSCPQGQCSS